MKCNLSDEIKKEIIKIASDYNVNKVVLYGSRARGDNKFNSDIDIAIYLDSSENKGIIFSEIEEIETLLKFDILFISRECSVNENIIKNIENEGIVIYERK